MSADVGPVLPDGIQVVVRFPGADPRLVDGAGLLRIQRAQDGPGLIDGAAGAAVAPDRRVARGGGAS